MEKKSKKPKRELAYFFTLFKLEGHTTWRMTTSFDLINETAGKAKITEVKKFKVNRITGEISEIK